MLKIRLAKFGRRGDVSYRIVVSEKRSKRDSNNLAILGIYDPQTKPATTKIDMKRYQSWINKGAQPTAAVMKLVEKK